MPSCVIRFCKNYTSKTNKSCGITFHRFPQDQLQQQKWIKFVRLERSENDWMPNIHSRICSVHFANEMFHTSNKSLRKLLYKNAMPCKKVIEDSHHNFDQEKETQSTFQEPEIDISDLNSILDTPGEDYLKTRLHKITMIKKKLMKDNKLLKQKNKRLIKRCENLKDIIRVLKEKNNFLKKKLHLLQNIDTEKH